MLKIKGTSIFISTLLCGMLLVGCSKDFINSVRPTDSALPSDVYKDSSSVRVFLNGIYRNMRNQWISIDQTAGNSTDAWGYNSIFLARDLKGKDILMPSSNWYYFDYQNENREPTYRRTRFTWYFFYELINQLNTLIDGTAKSTTILDQSKTHLIAEARALRAYFYFELTREFQLPFRKNAAAPGVPFYSQPASAENLDGKPRGTLQEDYDSINNDIEFALANLSDDRGTLAQVNLNVVEGMAARIYLEEGRWDDAVTAATNAIGADYGLDASGYPNNWNNASSPELLWVFPQTTENGGQSLYYGTPSSFFEKLGTGYGNFYMSREFVDHFSPTDIRNTFFQTDDDSTAATYLATNKFGKPSGVINPLINGENADLKQTDFNETLNMMRVGEMYLIVAEGLARGGNDGDAAAALLELQQDRDPDAVASGNTGQALIDEILLERRKELYGEIGVDWSDAKRLSMPIDRTGSNHPAGLDYVIPADDPRFNLKIPQQEIQANRAFSPSDQNP